MHCGGADVAGGGGGVATLPGSGGGGGGGPQAAARRHSPQPSLPLATHTSGPVDILVFPILKGADLDTISAKKVRQQLQQELGVDLSSRKEEIDQIIMADVDQVNSHSDEEQSEEEVPKGKDDSESEPESEGGDDDDYEPGAKKMARKPKASPKKRKTDDDDDSDEEWGKRKKVAVAKKGGGGAAGGRGKKSAFTKSFKLSPELADVVGSDVMPRHEVVKKLWAVIKERELQDPANKQYAICDDQLLKVIGVKRFRTFGMMKHLKDHFLEAA